MSGAGEALQAATMSALGVIEQMGVYEGPPVQAAFPYAIFEAGPEADWSHKTGLGRELRLAVTIRDKGERPVRLRSLIADTEASLSGAIAPDGWRLVTMQFVRSRLVRDKAAWAGLVEYRARMLRDEE